MCERGGAAIDPAAAVAVGISHRLHDAAQTLEPCFRSEVAANGFHDASHAEPLVLHTAGDVCGNTDEGGEWLQALIAVPFPVDLDAVGLVASTEPCLALLWIFRTAAADPPTHLPNGTKRHQ
ncbi:hypothetical protein D3C86_1754470 [compost metagenome]